MKWNTRIASDINMSNLLGNIYYDNCIIAEISQENGLFEVLLINNNNLTFPLEEFLEQIDKVTKRLDELNS